MKPKDTKYSTVEEYAEYLKTQEHLSHIEIIELNGHKCIKAIRVLPKEHAGEWVWFDCCNITNNEIFKDSNWIGHCSSCGKPMFKNEIGHYESEQESKYGMSWRGCTDCSARNSYNFMKVTQ